MVYNALKLGGAFGAPPNYWFFYPINSMTFVISGSGDPSAQALAIATKIASIRSALWRH